MIAAVTTALTDILGWVKTVIDSILTTGEQAGALNALLPLFAVGIGISVLFLGVKVIKSIVWGAN